MTESGLLCCGARDGGGLGAEGRNLFCALVLAVKKLLEKINALLNYSRMRYSLVAKLSVLHGIYYAKSGHFWHNMFLLPFYAL